MGNRTSQTVNGQATTYSYNALDQMTQSVTGGVTTTYAYDGRGNLATTTTGSDVTTYTYDALDRLTTVDLPAGADSAYTYDPNGYRVRQTLGSDTTNYLWDEFSAYGDVIRETNGTGAELASYTLANQQLIGQVRSGVANYYLQDGQGSTRALANATGNITDTYDYLAYGQLYSQTGTTTNSYLYTGQQFDSATGLYDLRARYYDPSVGRFVSRDTYPINYRNPIELNRYGYTANNPINRYDPRGSNFVEWLTETTAGHVIGGAIAGGVIGLISAQIFYMMARGGSCGPRMQEWADNVDYQSYMLTAALTGVGMGATMGFAGPLSGYVSAIFGGVGAGLSVYDMISGQDINLCNGVGLFGSVLGGLSGGGSVSIRIPWVRFGTFMADGSLVINPSLVFGGLRFIPLAEVPVGSVVVSTVGEIAVLMSSGGSDNNEGEDTSDDDAGAPPPDKWEQQLLEGYNEQQKAEMRRYMAEWDKSNFDNEAHSIIHHSQEHGFGDDYLTYTRKAHNFIIKGARRIPEFGVREDGTVLWVRKNGEFIIYRNRKIVTYGYNR